MSYYNARWYDSSLGRFAQADSIVPLASQGVQAWDRYAYANNNPIRYTDSSGHGIDCSMGDKSCQGGYLDPTYATYAMYNILQDRVDRGAIESDLEAFAQLSEYSASLTQGCTECFVRNMSSVLTGNGNPNPAISEWDARHGKRERDQGYRDSGDYGRLGQDGFDWVFRDPEHGGDQSRHFWMWTHVAYDDSPALADIGNTYHELFEEGNSYNDYALGVEGQILGTKLATGEVKPSGVGDYIRGTLSPNSSATWGWHLQYKITDWMR